MEPAVKGLSYLLSLCQQYGPLLVAVVFFVWRDFKREERLTTRINTLEDEMREVIFPLVENATEVIAANKAAMEQNTTVIERLERRMFDSK